MLHLTQKDSKAVSDVLGDLSRHTPCGFAITGSLAQRAFLPDFALMHSGERLADIDIVLLGESFAACPVTPTITEDFFVLDIRPTHKGYYFGLVHKGTGVWVDLFSLPYPYTLQTITVANTPYQAVSIETQVLYLAYDLFWRMRDSFPVRKKWCEKLRYLYGQKECVKEKVFAEYEAHRAHYIDVCPVDRALPSHADVYIHVALASADQYANPGYRDKIAFFFQYSCGAVVTSNGIAVESYPNFIRALFRMWKRTG